MRIESFFLSILFTLSAVFLETLCCSGQETKSYTLWQLPPRTSTQNMAYVVRTGDGKVIVIDGGNAGDAEYLKGFLAPLGNHVDAWFISHPHPDHVDALTAILNNLGQLKINNIYGSMPSLDWVAKYEAKPTSHLTTVKNFYQAVRKRDKTIHELQLGQILQFGDLKIQVLGIKNPEITANAINNSSIVLRFGDRYKSVLFTGDLGVQAGQKLMKTKYAGQLKSDYVQMAHHGQAGVDRNFYAAVEAKACLWPTPIWLWNNDKGTGKGSGPWGTLTVRQWMDELGIKKHYVSAYGISIIE